MEEKVYPLIPESWHPDIRMFTENEFRNLITVDGKIKSTNIDNINNHFNRDEFKPRDGELVKAIDDLTAFLEAYLARENGMVCDELKNAEADLRIKSQQKYDGPINFMGIYSSFK